MRIEVLTIPDCPHGGVALERAQQAAARCGVDPAEIRPVTVTTHEQAGQLRFAGSPTFLVDGRDAFPPTGQQPAAALACRVYADGNVLTGCPSVQQLAEVFRKIAAG